LLFKLFPDYDGVEPSSKCIPVDRYKTENISLKERPRHSRTIEVVDLYNEIEKDMSSRDDSNDEEPPLKRHRTKSNLAEVLEQQQQQMVKVEVEANQRVAAAEANAAAAHREKKAAEASLRDVEEDLVIQRETTQQVAVALDTLQGRFDAVCEIAAASGADVAKLRSIRDGTYLKL
jgi:hypothetical protein